MFMHSEDCGQFHGRDTQAFAGPRPPAKRRQLETEESRLGYRTSRATCGGFSLVELLVSMVVLSVIMGAVLTALSSSQEAYGVTELQSDMYENVRGAAELMTQEIGQAGSVSLPASKLTAAVAANAAAQTVTVSSTTSMYAGTGTTGEGVLVDPGGANPELVHLTNVSSSSITGIFLNAHPINAPIIVLGVFPSGIVPTTMTDGSTSNPGAAVSTLNLYGDINGDGSLVYVRYTCDLSVTPGTLTRSVTTITPGNTTINAAQTILSTLIKNPNTPTYPTGTPCFTYTTPPAVGGKTFVTNVGLTISVQSLKPDPKTGAYMQMTKSFLNLSPRNILTGYELAQAGVNNAALNNRLQPTPSNVTAY
jgi:prepilin-type N-terminal cleavage/methylation domain-containing protein